MATPTVAELKARARYSIGEHVHFQGPRRWRVVRRYYNLRQRAILYDLVLEHGDMEALRIRECDMVPAG